VCLWCGFADCRREVADDTGVGLGSIGQVRGSENLSRRIRGG
jgi:hypothetical protein